VRFYGIKLLSPTTGAVQAFDPTTGKFADSPGAPFTWASHDASGNFIATALNVELDVPALPFGASQGGSSLRVWGVGLPALSQANDLAGYGLEIQGGMKPPYQLNKAAAPGVLVSGQVFQGFGNWEGLAQHLDLVVFSQAADPSLEAAIPFSWPANQPLGIAIANALTAAFPSFTVQGQDSVQRLVQDHDEQGYYQSLRSFSEYVLDVSQSGSYSGINIRAVGSVFYLYDNVAPGTPIQIAFEDLIGQPTWISASTLTFSTVMRGDIQLGQAVTMPKGLLPPYALTTPAAAVPNAPAASRSVFQGTFTVIEVHHYGNFREPSAEAWRTVFVAVPNDAVPNVIGTGTPVSP
jgi:hypothetical protein